MIDVEVWPPEGSSAFEQELGDWLTKRARRVSIDLVRADPDEPWVVDCEPHGRRGPGWSVPSLGENVPAEVASFAGLLERGAVALSAAKAAHHRQSREAAVLARALAAFAVSRPAAVLDRPDGEVGAAAAASRAARPAVLTKVSEWAVDEVIEPPRIRRPRPAAVLSEPTRRSLDHPYGGSRMETAVWRQPREDSRVKAE